MTLPASRLALVALCVLPAVGVGLPGSRPLVVASFIHSCDASDPEPRLRTTYTAEGRPRPRPESAAVEVFESGSPPARRYVVIGEVGVLASGSRTPVSELTDWARRGARRLGGDALVELSYDDAASVRPAAGPVGLLYLKATVVRWAPGDSPGATGAPGS
jgi:hypothetical protein